MSFKLRELQAFDAFMRLRGMKAAATELGVKQPMVSKLLSSLEQKAGFEMFYRKRNQLVPTPEAYLLNESIQRVLAGLREVANDAEAIANRQRGQIIIAAQPIFCDTFLVQTVAQFARAHPDVGIRLVDAGLETILKMMGDRSCDMALGITLDVDVEGVEITPLAACEAKCAVPVGHGLDKPGAIPLPRIRDETFVELHAGSPLRTRVDSLMQSIGLQRRIAVEVRQERGVCAHVAEGTGIAIIDPIAELLTDRTRVVIKPLIPTIDWEIALFVPSDRPLSRVAKTFADHLRADVEQLCRRGLVTKIGTPAGSNDFMPDDGVPRPAPSAEVREDDQPPVRR